MKKIILMFLLVCTFTQLSALSTGDEAIELKTKFYNGKIFKTKFYIVDAKNQKKLKILVFARLLADDFLHSDSLIKNIGSRKNVSLAFAATSENEIGTFLKERPAFQYPLLFDRNAIKTYMEQNMIYPRAFVINYENKIIWDGEMIDLPDMLDKFENGKYDLEVNRKINRHLAEMQNALRAGSEYQLDRAARAILALEPGNLACLRMRMFSFENTNRFAEAWAFLDEFRRKYPNEKHLYMLQMDMAARYRQFSEAGAQVARAFINSKLGTANDWLLLSFLLLNHYENNTEALNCAGDLLKRLNSNSFGNDIMQKSLFFRTCALLHYKRCDLIEAVKNQSLACDVSNDAENRKILKYYQNLQKK